MTIRTKLQFILLASVSSVLLLGLAMIYTTRQVTLVNEKSLLVDEIVSGMFELNLLANEGGITDSEILCAALLHDTVEDTETKPEELTDAFGPVISGIVMEVTDDKSLPKVERKQAQVDHAPHQNQTTDNNSGKVIHNRGKIRSFLWLFFRHPGTTLIPKGF